MNKNIVIPIVVLMGVFLAFAAYAAWENEKDPTSEVKDPISEEMATNFIETMQNGGYDEGYGALNDNMRSQLSATAFISTWGFNVGVMGDLDKIDKIVVTEVNNNKVTNSFCSFKYGGKQIRVTFDQEGKVGGLYFFEYSPRSVDLLPNNLKESDIKLNAGTSLELKGKIASSVNSDNKVAAVIVHGSGPNDMDMTMGMNVMYRDLAWGIAENGIDVLRYDKRTHAYPVNDPAYTVKEETINDAIAAARLMKDKGYEKVFLIGHSLGGMLAPRIVSESNGAFDGFISMAGTPRSPLDLIVDQLTSSAKSQADILYIAAEKNKLNGMDSWDDARLKSTVIFVDYGGLSAYYLKEMDSKNAGDIARLLDVPMMFVQGGKDFQVYANKDYQKWKEILSDRPNATFKLYDELNHMFAKTVGTTLVEKAIEYLVRNDTSKEVIKDMSEFIKNNT